MIERVELVAVPKPALLLEYSELAGQGGRDRHESCRVRALRTVTVRRGDDLISLDRRILRRSLHIAVVGSGVRSLGDVEVVDA